MRQVAVLLGLTCGWLELLACGVVVRLLAVQAAVEAGGRHSSSAHARPHPHHLSAGSSPEGVRAWQALAALQDGKAPPTPGAANSSFKRSSLQEPLLFESPAWQLELSNMTGAIVGLRFKGGSSSGSSGGRDPGSSSSSMPWPWQPLLSWLRLPNAMSWRGADSWLGARRQQEGGPSWAGFDAPLALPVYETFSEDQYDVIWTQYAYQAPDIAEWFHRDFGKPNATGGCCKRAGGQGLVRAPVRLVSRCRSSAACTHAFSCFTKLDSTQSPSAPPAIFHSQGPGAAGCVPAPGEGRVVEAGRRRRPTCGRQGDL